MKYVEWPYFHAHIIYVHLLVYSKNSPYFRQWWFMAPTSARVRWKPWGGEEYPLLTVPMATSSNIYYGCC